MTYFINTVRSIILWVLLALAASLICGCTSNSSRPSFQAKSFILCTSTWGPSLIILDPDGCSSVDQLLQNTYMLDGMVVAEAGPETELVRDVRTKLAAILPGYEMMQIERSLSDSYSKAALEHRSVQGRFFANAGQRLVVFGRLGGQADGMAGMAFLDGGLGWPRSEFTPVSVFIRDWEELRGLLHEYRYVNSLMVLSGQDEFAGTYVIKGFEPSEVPSWAQDRVQPR
jgi:hypothetical protein